MLLFYLLIVFVWSAECSRNQREEYLIGGASDRKIRFKRAIGGKRHYRFDFCDGTLWSDKVYYREAKADSRFYGMALIWDKNYILAPKIPLMALLKEEEKGGGDYWDRHIQFGDYDTIKDYYTGEINVKEGVKRQDGKPGRPYGLRYVGDANRYFGVAVRLNKGTDPKGAFTFRNRFVLHGKGTPAEDCWFVGWSEQPQNGTKKADTRYLVHFPVEIIKNSCSDHVCQFRKSDGLPGGFCNTFQESGGVIECLGDQDVAYVPGFPCIHYIVFPNPKFSKVANCTGEASAYHAPYLWDEVDKVINPPDGGHTELSGKQSDNCSQS